MEGIVLFAISGGGNYMEVILIINEITVDLRGTFRAKLHSAPARRSVTRVCGIPGMRYPWKVEEKMGYLQLRILT